MHVMQKALRSPIATALVSLIGAGLLLLTAITYLPDQGRWLSTLATNNMTRTWWLGSLASYGLHILAAAAVLWALTWFLNRRQTLANAGHFWLLAFWTGWGIAFTLLILGFPFWYQNVYNSTFLLTRNGYPFITGLFVFLLIQPWVLKYAKTAQLSLLTWGLLFLNLLFPFDILKTGSGATFSGALFFGLLATILSQRPHWFHKRAWLTLPVGLLSLVGMGWYQASRQAAMSGASRFVIPLSPLVLIPAILIVQGMFSLTTNQTLSKRALWWQTVTRLTILTAGLIGTGAAYSNLWVRTASFFQRHLSFLGPLWVIASAMVFTGFAFALTTTVVWLIPRLKIWQRFTSNWSFTSDRGLKIIADEWPSILRRISHEYWRPAVAFIVFYIVQCLSSLLMNQSWHMAELMTHAKDNIISSTIIAGNSKMLGGTLIMLAAYWFILALFNRYWLALISVATFCMGFGIAARLKLLSRSEPIVPSDLAELNNIKELFSLVSTWILVLVAVWLVITIIAIVVLERHSASARQTWQTRLAKLLLSGWFLFGLTGLNGYGQIQDHILKAVNLWTESNIDEVLYAQQNGPLMSFISLLDVKIMDKPQGYSQAAVAKVVKRYERRAQQINRKRTTTTKKLTVVFNLSESFSNPTAIAGVKLNKNPIPYITKLKTETTSGRMIAASFGGGTANMEYMSLTGMSMGLFASSGVVPNTTVVPKETIAPNVGNLFNYAAAIHPYTGGYYNRVAVYKKYHFNKFAYLGSKYKIIDQHKIGTSIYNSDATAYANAYAQLTNHPSSQFINLITIQNHMPFTQDWYPEYDYTVSGKGFTSTQKREIERYTQGIHYTDAAVKAFIKQIDQLKRPIIFVFYGDHLPGTYTLPNRVDKYATDYFVYANKYARAHGAKTKLAHKQYVSTNDFIAMALEQGNAKVDGYAALLTDVADKLPALWQSKENPVGIETKDQVFVNDKGKPVTEAHLTKAQKQILADYRLIQYDTTTGKDYATKLGFDQAK